MPRRLHLEVELPDEVLTHVRDEEIALKAKEALVMELLREHQISQGKAAEMLGIHRDDLFDLITRLLPLVCRPAHGPTGGPSRRTGHPLGTHAPVGGLAAHSARGAVSLERLDINADGDLLYTFTRPWSDGIIGITLSPLELIEKLAALVPLPRQHQVRYGGCLAPQSHVRGAIILTLRQQGADEPAGSTAAPNWSWVRLLKRVFAKDMARCPGCQQGRLRIMAAITERRVIQKILCHVKRAVDPPRIAPAQQAAFAWDM